MSTSTDDWQSALKASLLPKQPFSLVALYFIPEGLELVE